MNINMFNKTAGSIDYNTIQSHHKRNQSDQYYQFQLVSLNHIRIITNKPGTKILRFYNTIKIAIENPTSSSLLSLLSQSSLTQSYIFTRQSWRCNLIFERKSTPPLRTKLILPNQKTNDSDDGTPSWRVTVRGPVPTRADTLQSKHTCKSTTPTSSHRFLNAGGQTPRRKHSHQINRADPFPKPITAAEVPHLNVTRKEWEREE